MTQQTNNVEIPIVLAGRYKIKSEKRERFLELANSGLEPSRAESGNISYSFYEEAGIPALFRLILSAQSYYLLSFG